jgi:hypothetical protein
MQGIHEELKKTIVENQKQTNLQMEALMVTLKSSNNSEERSK